MPPSDTLTALFTHIPEVITREWLIDTRSTAQLCQGHTNLTEGSIVKKIVFRIEFDPALASRKSCLTEDDDRESGMATPWLDAKQLFTNIQDVIAEQITLHNRSQLKRATEHKADKVELLVKTFTHQGHSRPITPELSPHIGTGEFSSVRTESIAPGDSATQITSRTRKSTFTAVRNGKFYTVRPKKSSSGSTRS